MILTKICKIISQKASRRKKANIVTDPLDIKSKGEVIIIIWFGPIATIIQCKLKLLPTSALSV